MDPGLQEMLEEGDGEDEVSLIIRLVDPARTPPGVRVVSRFGTVITARARRAQIPEIWKDATVESVKPPKALAPELEVMDGEVEPEAPMDIRRSEGLGATGRGVVVGFVDWGVDPFHPDLQDAPDPDHPLPRTRLRAIWDHRGTGGPAPEPFGYGRLITAEEIDRASLEDDPYGKIRYDPSDFDAGLGSHGMHTMSIAIGTGRGGGPAGVAPDAEGVFVSLGKSGSRDVPLGSSVELLEAIDFIGRVAGPQPCVVNLSLGRHAGEHTGKTLVEIAMDQFLTLAPSRAIVQSCGNYWERRVHGSWNLRPGESRTFRVEVDPNDRTTNELDIWIPSRDRVVVELASTDGRVRERVPPGRSARTLIGGREVARTRYRQSDPQTGDHECTIFLEPNPDVRIWEVTLVGEDVVDGRVHAWIERDSGCRTCQSHFAVDEADPRTSIGTIANGYRTLVVGAVSGHDPDRPLARFSSSGPTRDGRQKPDLVAPGHMVLGARSGGSRVGPVPLYVRMSGTSMAAPHVTGAVALVFDRAARPMPIEETRRIVLAACDPPPAGADAARFGSGYLNIPRALELAGAGGALMSSLKPEHVPTETDAEDDATESASLEAEEEPAIETVEADDDAETGDEAIWDEAFVDEGASDTAEEVEIGPELDETATALGIETVTPALEAEAVGPCADVPVPPASRPRVLVRGSVHPAVREAQRDINALHLFRIMGGESPIDDAPLVEDCIFGRHTFAATLSFQKLVFPGQPVEHDGKIGPHTWGQLDAIDVGPAGVAQLTVDALRITDDAFAASLSWDQIIGLDTATLDLDLAASGLPPAVMPPTVPVIVTSRPANGFSGRATLSSSVTVDVPLQGPHPADPNRMIYRLRQPLDRVGAFGAVETSLKEVATVARKGGTSDGIFRRTIGWAPRGAATQPTVPGARTGDETVERPDAFALFRAGGVEVITVSVLPLPNWRIPAPVKRLVRSPADVFYYSGHGSSSSGSLLIDTGPTPERCKSPGPFDPWLGSGDLVGVWRSPMDLDVLILAGCSVLNIDFSGSPPTGPGLDWAGLLTAKGGPLVALLGYRGAAPCDSPVGDRIAEQMAQRMARGSTNFARDWLEVNGNNRARNAAAMDGRGFWWIERSLLSGFSIEGPRAIP